jgi:hypothetical protein
MTDLASISDEWWHGGGKTVGGDYWWGGDEDEYFDADGKPISKEEYEKQFEDQVKMPVEPEYPEQPQFVGDPTQFKPMPFDPNNPMMYMGSGSPFYHLRGGDLDVNWDEVFGGPEYDEAKRKREEACKICRGEKSPDDVAMEYLRGGEQGDDELARRMAEYLAPHISSGIGQVADGIQEFFKSPEQREQEKRDKEALEEAERKKKEREESSWSSYLSPFFHLSGGANDKYIAMAKEFAKRAGYKDWDTLRRADDGEHKLELRGVKFGRKGYGDFIKYSLEKGVDEAQKHRSAYLSRATKIKGDWAKDMYSPNSLAINILWDGKSSCPMSGGGKTQSELEAMSVPKLIEYGKSQGVKGLDGKTKAIIVDKILKQAPEAEVVAPSSSEIKAPQLAKMLMMEANLDKDIIPLAKKKGIERILHKNKKTLVNELVDKLVDEGEIQQGDSITKIPQLVRYLFGKDVTPYPEEESDEEEEEPEVEVDEYEWDGVKYFVEEPREGLEFKDRRVFDPESYEELGTLGEEMWRGLAVDVADSEYDGMELSIGRPDAVIQPAPEPAPKPATKYPELRPTEDYKASDGLKYERNADGRIPEIVVNAPRGVGSVRFPSGTPAEFIEKYIASRKPKGRGKPVLAPQDVLEGKKDNPLVEETIEEPMDDGDIRQYLPNAKIMRYSALSRLSDIEQILPTDKSYVILLYENTPGSGHWVALMRYGRTIEFFCSYGSKIDAPLRWQNPKDNAMLGQRQPYLSILLNKAKGKFRAIYNPVAYQSSKQGVATCGAWDVMRINQMKNHNQDLQDFHEYMESVKKETGLTYDEIVVNYVSKR